MVPWEAEGLLHGSLGGSRRRGALPAVAAEVGATVQQTMLAWAMRQPRGASPGTGSIGNVSVIPGTNDAAHQLSNLEVPEVASRLTVAHLDRLDAMGRNLGAMPSGWRLWDNMPH